VNPPFIMRPFARESKVSVAYAMVAGVFCCVIFAIIAHAEPAVAATTCSDSLQAKIDAAPVEGTVTAGPCIYREQVEITKSLTLVGQEGSEIRGSDVWGDWEAGGTDWVSSKTVPQVYQEDVSCEKNYPYRCAWPEQVFINGIHQEQLAVGSDPAPGQFALDSDRRVVLGSDPTGKTVEVSTRRHWVTGTAAADHVTIRGFTMKHAMTDWRCGGIQSREPSSGSGSSFRSCRFEPDGEDWNVYDSDFSYAHGAGVSLRGDNTNIEVTRVHHNGELGIHNPGDGALIQDVELDNNNTEHFCIRPSTDYCVAVDTDGESGIQGGSPLTESGGIKAAGGRGNITLDRMNVHHNYGNGIWFDVAAHDIVVKNSRAYENARHGIFFEISYRAQIINNVLYENGWATPESTLGAGLEVGTSDNADVYGNVLAWNAYGILARCSSGRDNPMCKGNFIHDNIIIGESPTRLFGWMGQPAFFNKPSNRGVSNDYWYDAPEPSGCFAWDGKLSTLSAFNATRGEENGRYLTRSKKDAVTANKGIPARPKPH
jgi:Right handed beta helix region